MLEAPLLCKTRVSCHWLERYRTLYELQQDTYPERDHMHSVECMLACLAIDKVIIGRCRSNWPDACLRFWPLAAVIVWKLLCKPLLERSSTDVAVC